MSRRQSVVSGRPSVAAGAAAGLAPVVSVHGQPLAVHAVEGDVEAITEVGEADSEAALTVHAAHSESCLVTRHCGRGHFLWSQVQFGRSF